jgi:hypothetical protein
MFIILEIKRESVGLQFSARYLLSQGINIGHLNQNGIKRTSVGKWQRRLIPGL